MIQNPSILFVSKDAEYLPAIYYMILYKKTFGKLTTEERRASKKARHVPLKPRRR